MTMNKNFVCWKIIVSALSLYRSQILHRLFIVIENIFHIEYKQNPNKQHLVALPAKL